ncbi:MAG: alpha/beta fold hydrolase [Planctomycetota bacterium]
MIAPYARPCAPPLWARGGQAQTLLGHFLPAGGEALGPGVPGVERRELEVGSPAGDRIVVLDAGPTGRGPLDGVTVHLFHGLTGSSDSSYVRLAADVVRARGARVRLFNHRGQGPGEGLARGLYHSGSWPDLFAAVADARARDAAGEGGPHVGVGFSLSANTLLLGAARAADHPGCPDAVLAVNPPVDLAATADAIRAGFNRVYDRNFVAGLKRALDERRARDPATYGALEVPRGASVRTFDERVTAPLAGYGSADAYYADCSSGPELAALGVPSVVLSSADDPFVPASTIAAAVERARAARHDASPPLHLHLESTGGHLGYLARGAERRWLAGALGWYVEELVRAGRSRSTSG